MYRHAHARIGPIVRRIRNPPIRIAYIYPCDSAGCRNEFLCTNSQTDYIDGFEFRQRVGRLQRRLGRFRGVPGVFRVFRGCSGGVPGCSGCVPGVFWGVRVCSRVFRGVPGFTDTLQKGNGPSLNNYVYDWTWTWTADCSLQFPWGKFEKITRVFGTKIQLNGRAIGANRVE